MPRMVPTQPHSMPGPSCSQGGAGGREPGPLPARFTRKCCEEQGGHRAAQMQLLQLSASPAVAA